MDERLRFVARLLDGEKMAPLCRSFGISRKTGYKIFERYKETGLEGLTDRSRRPYRQANQLPFQVEQLIVTLKKEQPSWGAPKIRERLKRRYPDVHTPAVSTVHTQCWTATTWSTGGGVVGTEPRAPRCRSHARQTICGAPTTRANSCWRTGAIATR